MDSDRPGSLLQSMGLEVFGWFEMFDGPDHLAGKTAALIGNRGDAMWQVFCKSEFISDGETNPLDRWTKANIAEIANEIEATALYPFLDGRAQYWPFQQWAKAATGLQQSPQGMLIDPEYGLWQAFRAVLVFNEPVEIPKPVDFEHPCDHCVEKPCLATCPVAAISMGRFDANVCIDHVLSERDKICSSKGCVSRNACPVGRKHAYSVAQQAFHMCAFTG